MGQDAQDSITVVCSHHLTDNDGGHTDYSNAVSIPAATIALALNSATANEGDTVGISVSFTGDTSGTSVEVDWGDGTVNNEASHVYADNNTYRITASLKDATA